MATADEMAFWHEHGYVVLHDAVPPEQCAAAEEAIWSFLGMDRDDVAPEQGAFTCVPAGQAETVSFRDIQRCESNERYGARHAHPPTNERHYQRYLAVDVVAVCAGQARSNMTSPFCAAPQLLANWIVATMTKATIIVTNATAGSNRGMARSPAYIAPHKTAPGLQRLRQANLAEGEHVRLRAGVEEFDFERAVVDRP